MTEFDRLAAANFWRDRGAAAESAVRRDRGVRRLLLGRDARQARIDKLLLRAQTISEALNAGLKRRTRATRRRFRRTFRCARGLKAKPPLL